MPRALVFVRAPVAFAACCGSYDQPGRAGGDYGAPVT